MKIVDQAANAVSFVEDKVHESHFDRIIWMLRTRRDQAAREVPEWERLRELASSNGHRFFLHKLNLVLRFHHFTPSIDLVVDVDLDWENGQGARQSTSLSHCGGLGGNGTERSSPVRFIQHPKCLGETS